MKSNSTYLAIREAIACTLISLKLLAQTNDSTSKSIPKILKLSHTQNTPDSISENIGYNINGITRRWTDNIIGSVVTYINPFSRKALKRKVGINLGWGSYLTEKTNSKLYGYNNQKFQNESTRINGNRFIFIIEINDTHSLHFSEQQLLKRKNQRQISCGDTDRSGKKLRKRLNCRNGFI